MNISNVVTCWVPKSKLSLNMITHQYVEKMIRSAMDEIETMLGYLVSTRVSTSFNNMIVARAIFAHKLIPLQFWRGSPITYP